MVKNVLLESQIINIGLTPLRAIFEPAPTRDYEEWQKIALNLLVHQTEEALES